MLTISQTAKLLKIDKKTLMRWDKDGKFTAKREKVSKTRCYDEKEVYNHALWFEIRRKHKAHLRVLQDVRKEADKFIRTFPLNPLEDNKPFRLTDMKRAYETLDKWEEDDIVISKEYNKLAIGFTPKIDPEY
ncbi:MAG: MerR family transcriptional regulator [Nanoarchaeota archaeon]